MFRGLWRGTYHGHCLRCIRRRVAEPERGAGAPALLEKRLDAGVHADCVARPIRVRESFRGASRGLQEVTERLVGLLLCEEQRRFPEWGKGTSSLARGVQRLLARGVESPRVSRVPGLPSTTAGLAKKPVLIYSIRLLCSSARSPARSQHSLRAGPVTPVS